MGEAATAAKVVPGFEHLPGHHCGSTALRDLLHFHGASLSEEMVFGLAAGPCFYYVELEGVSPSRFTSGRAAHLEQLFLKLTEAPLRMRTEADPDAAWEMAREAIDADRPVILLTDLYHLDHYGSSAHFPGHAVVLCGYDGELAYLADTGFEQIQRTTLESLRAARHGSHPFGTLRGEMIDLPPGSELDVGALRAAAPRAIAAAAALMAEPEHPGVEGLPALRLLAERIGSWAEAEDWRWSARFGYQVIERRGTGGGNFRPMYARFLAEVGHPGAPLAGEAAERWSALAGLLFEASEGERPDPAQWRAIAAAAADVLEAEERLWGELGG